MSAPDTNIKTQEKRHKPSLLGIGAAVGFAAILLVMYLFWLAYQGDDPEGAAAQVDSRTGAIVSTD